MIDEEEAASKITELEATSEIIQRDSTKSQKTTPNVEHKRRGSVKAKKKTVLKKKKTGNKSKKSDSRLGYSEGAEEGKTPLGESHTTTFNQDEITAGNTGHQTPL
jgi:hypothetical protein